MKKKNNNFFKNKHLLKKKKKKILHFKYDEKKKKYIYLFKYFYKNKKIKKGIFYKKPKINEILYPFFLNMKLVSEYLKKN